MDYEILQDVHRENLRRRVLNLMNDGWEPLGGVAIVPDEELGYEYMQAMVKREDEGSPACQHELTTDEHGTYCVRCLKAKE